MNERPQKPRYLSYLLRIWQTNDGERQIWQASLERPGSREHLGFTSLLKLYDFLDAQTGRTEEDDGPPG